MKHYAMTVIKGKAMFMHGFIWVLHTKKPIPTGFKVDHINGDPHDNQTANLHLVPCPPGMEYMGDRDLTNEEGLGLKNN